MFLLGSRWRRVMGTRPPPPHIGVCYSERR